MARQKWFTAELTEIGPSGDDGAIICAVYECRALLTPTMKVVVSLDGFGSTLVTCDEHDDMYER